MKIHNLFVYALALMSCSQDPAHFAIEGTMDSKGEGEYVYLSRFELDGSFDKIDSAQVLNGTFAFTGDVDAPYLAQISTANPKEQPCAFIIEEGKIQVSFNGYATASGTPTNDSITSYKEETFVAVSEMQDLRFAMQEHKKNETLTPAIEKELGTKAYTIQNKSRDLAKIFAKTNAKTLAGLYVIYYNMHLFAYPEVQEILDLAKPTEGETRLYQALKEKEAILARRQIGAKLTDVVLPNLNGQLDSLSNYIGKGNYVLLDFWASWCGPCRKEIPTLVEVYKQYHDKGFEIVGISFDNDSASWKGAVDRYGMSWPQFSDLKGWTSAGGRAYGINSIPATLLFDPSGTIVATDVHAEELGMTLDAYFP